VQGRSAVLGIHRFVCGDRVDLDGGVGKECLHLDELKHAVVVDVVPAKGEAGWVYGGGEWDRKDVPVEVRECR
jgi:hypothetical protein